MKSENNNKNHKNYENRGHVMRFLKSKYPTVEVTIPNYS
jgi:hypothetical protein